MFQLTVIGGKVRVIDHNCSYNSREDVMSDCKFGCKVYRCKVCGTRSVLHSRTYGCRTVK